MMNNLKPKPSEISYIAQMAKELAKMANENKAEVLSALLQLCAHEGKRYVLEAQRKASNK